MRFLLLIIPLFFIFACESEPPVMQHDYIPNINCLDLSEQECDEKLMRDYIPPASHPQIKRKKKSRRGA